MLMKFSLTSTRFLKIWCLFHNYSSFPPGSRGLGSCPARRHVHSYPSTAAFLDLSGGLLCFVGFPHFVDVHDFFHTSHWLIRTSLDLHFWGYIFLSCFLLFMLIWNNASESAFLGGKPRVRRGAGGGGCLTWLLARTDSKKRHQRGLWGAGRGAAPSRFESRVRETAVTWEKEAPE